MSPTWVHHARPPEAEPARNMRDMLGSFAHTHRNPAMPTMHIELFEGRTPEKKRELVRALTERTCEVLGCPPDSVDIILTEISKDRWATGGVFWSEKG